MKAYDRMKNLVEKNTGNISVLEEEIDVELQMQYFKESKACKKNLNKESVLFSRDDLFSDAVDIKFKKLLLCALASINEVVAFRTIEQYCKSPDSVLKEWAKLAYQESKMLLQSSLLDKAPLFISTGLGGKGSKLRYFIVITSKHNKPFSLIQKSIIEGEFEYAFNKNNTEIETIEYCACYVAVTALIPIEVRLKKSLRSIIQRCNELGDFVSTSIIVTNVKKLSAEEIHTFIEKKKNDN